MTEIITVRPKPKPSQEMIRYNGENPGEVAEWLADQGIDCSVLFKATGSTLSIGGYRVDIPSSAGGCVYLDESGKTWTPGQIESNFEVL